MILGPDNVHASCFEELNTAVEALAGTRKVVFNAHDVPESWIPEGAIVYNLENVGIQVSPWAFQGRKLWDFSRRNVENWRKSGREVTYVPVGYHHSMERFKKVPWDECQYDVVFCGAPNERRNYILDALVERGLRVCQVPHTLYGPERDKLLATSRLALNVLYYEQGTHPVLRSAHAVANWLPILCENSPEMPDWALLRCDYKDLVNKATYFVRRRREWLDHFAEAAYLAFHMSPMTLPSA